MDLLNTVLFWGAVILSVIAVYESWLPARDGKKVKAPRELPLSAEHERVAVIVIAVVAVAVRVWRFGSVPGGINQDGAMAAVDALALSRYGTDRFGMFMPVHLTAWGHSQMSALLSYLMVPFIKVLGLTVTAMHLPQLLVSLAGLWCLYLLVREAFDRQAGLIAFALCAIDPWHILQSRWALDCNLFPHFLVFGLLLLVLALKGKRRTLSLVGSMVMFGLSMYCYGVAIYTIPPLLLAVCVYLLAKKEATWGEAGLALGVYLLVAWPFIATMAINALGGSTITTPLFTIPLFPNSMRSNDILFFVEDKWGQLKANATCLLNVTLLQTKDLPWNDVEGFGTMYLFSMPFFFAGLSGAIRQLRKSSGAVLLIMSLLAGVWCGLITGYVNVNRINIIYYPILILIALGIYEVLRWVPFRKLGCGVAAGYALAFCLFTHTYFTTYADTVAYSFFQDLTQAVEAVKDADVDRFYITSENYYRSADVSEILTQFIHKVDAKYYQGVETPQGELPYREKYTFRPISEVPIDPTAAYVATANDLGYFPDQWYDITQYGGFYAVVPR